MDLLERATAEAGTGRRHPWEVARARSILRLIRAEGHPVRQILDMGCGDGYTGRFLFVSLGAERYCGVDCNLTDAECASWSRADGRLRFQTELPSEPVSFDLVLLCDVLEHLEQPEQLLREVFARLAPGGILLVTVPAFDLLFSAHDRVLGHHRRYSRRSLGQLFASSAITEERGGYLFSSLLVPRAQAVLWEKLRPKPGAPLRAEGLGAWRGGPLVSTLLTEVLDWENRALVALASAHLKLPGLSVWSLARRRDTPS